MRHKSEIRNPKSEIRKILVAAFTILVAQVSFAITGDEIIRKVDANMTYGTARMESRMVIHVDQEIREKTMLSYAKGRSTSYSEFLSPPRDKGVKYLKIEENMWMYLPSVDKIIKISGSMLRQSMMGSDFSYEDALESNKLLEKYNATLVKEERIPITFKTGGRPVIKERDCYVIDLVAKVQDITYYKRTTWIDKELFVPVKEDLFAMSGKRLKTMTLGDVQKFGSRYYPTYMTMKNLLREGSLTEMFIDKAAFDVGVPAGVFTQGNLSK